MIRAQLSRNLFWVLFFVEMGIAHAQPVPTNEPVSPIPTEPTAPDSVKSEIDALKQSHQALEQKMLKLEQERDQRFEKLTLENKDLHKKIESIEIRQAEQSEEIEHQNQRLQLYGWMDVQMLSAYDLDENSNLYGYLTSGITGFLVGNINLIVDARPADKWRALVETKFTFAPAGQWENPVQSGRGALTRITTTFIENHTGVSEASWGGVVIDRAWLEWAPRDFFKITVGNFFTPYGIWNLDHGTPVIIGVRPPLLLMLSLFPSRQTGIKLHGDLFFDQERLEYALYLSNGRGPIQNMDLDNHKAFGGRLAFTTRRLGELQLGFSWYVGRYTDNQLLIDTSKEHRTQAPIMPRLKEQILMQYDEAVFGSDINYSFNGLSLMGEAVYSMIRFNDPYRPIDFPNSSFSMAHGFEPLPLADFATFSFYALICYRLPWIDLRPYVKNEWVSTSDLVDWDKLHAITLGLNYRPVPRIVLKAEWGYYYFPNDPDYTINKEFLETIDRSISIFTLMAAVSF